VHLKTYFLDSHNFIAFAGKASKSDALPVPFLRQAYEYYLISIPHNMSAAKCPIPKNKGSIGVCYSPRPNKDNPTP